MSDNTKRKLTPQEQGRKGAAMREAKKQAIETGTWVELPDWGISFSPAGDKIEGLVKSEAIAMPVGEPTLTLMAEPDLAKVDEGAHMADGGRIDPVLAAVDNTPAGSKVAAVQTLVAAGWSEDDAMQAVMAKGNVAQPAVQPEMPAHVAADQGSVEAIRAEQLERYQERMRDYVPPVLDETFEVTMPVKFADYVRKWAAMESVRRRREVTPADGIQMMIRRFWKDDPERHLYEHLQSGTASGPADKFDPTTGAYSA